jgi:8-oxo-dGTP diphosphatase
MIIDKIVLMASGIIKKDNKIILLQRGDKSSFPDHWQFPEGKIEEGETPNKALKREMKEEIRCDIGSLKFQTVFYNSLEAKGLHFLAVRSVFSVKLKSTDIKLSEEHKNYGWFTKKEALNLSLLPGIKEILEKLTF